MSAHTTEPLSPAQRLARAAGNLSTRSHAAAVAAFRWWRTWYAAASSTRARFARGSLAVALFALLLAAPGLLGWAAVRILIAGAEALAVRLLQAARWVGDRALAHDLYNLAATVGHPAGAWLHQPAAPRPASPRVLAWSWLLLGLLLFLSARAGNLAARFSWAALSAATGAAVWQAAPSGSRTAAAVVTAGLWLLLAPSAYGRTERAPQRQEISLGGTLVALVVQQFVNAAPAPASTSSAPARGAALPVAHTPEPAARPVAVSVSGFRCRYCDTAVNWASAPSEPERTWRSGTGSTYCPMAPTPDVEINVPGQAHLAL